MKLLRFCGPCPLAAFVLLAVAAPSNLTSAEAPPHAAADRILREMGDFLASAGELAFEAEISYDTLAANGQKIQFGGVARIAVRRPDRLHVEFNGDERQNQTIFDGKRFTVYDAAANVYVATEVPPTLDAAIDRMVETYGFSVPTADLVYADPYRTLIENVEAGFVVGRHAVAGTPCHHLAFSQETIDWQIWIEDGPQPVPRQLLITYKNEPGSPQYLARLSNWSFQPRFSDHYFRFRAPAGADEIDFLPIRRGEVKP
jgi:hypothetical protein